MDEMKNHGDGAESTNTAGDKTRAIPTAPLTAELYTDNSFRGRAGRAISRYGYLAICFIVPALLMWLAYASRNVFPFGEESVLVLDLNGQYVYYFEALRDIITEGGSFLYTFRRALG